MNAISKQIQEPEPGAEMADSRSVVGAIWLKNEAARARTGAAKKERRAERLSRKLEESSEERQQNVRRTVRQGLAEAMTEVG